MQTADIEMDAMGLLVNMNNAQKRWKHHVDRRQIPEFPDSRVQLKLFVKDSTWRERLRFYFVKNQRTSLRIRLFNFILKVCSVSLYVFRAIYENPETTTCCGWCERNWTGSTNPWWTDQYEFSWWPIIWVERPFGVWIIQVILAFLSLIQAIITIFVDYKGNLWQNIFTLNNFLELLCTVPFIVSVCWPPLRCLFVPVFLNIWLANSRLNNMINDLQRVTQKQKSAMFNQIIVLLATITALLLTCICSVQQLERAGKYRMDIFDSLWFVIVTFSTVGYGDITPTIWPSRVVVIVTIVVALGVLPSQLEDLAHIWSQRQKQGGEYSRQRATTEKHVIVCATELRLDVIMEFLNEFYAHPFFQKHYVVLLSPSELDGPLRTFLQIPIWTERVIYLQGSALRETDLMRAKLDAAEACFILTSRQETNRDAADEKTILRAMACKDHAPHCPLYVQILNPASKFHIQFADQVICDEEFKYALLAMNCYIPGLSTMITLLAHTSKGQEGNALKAEWKQHFGKSAGNEIYHVIAEESKFFGEFIGYRFAHASQLAHAKCGAVLFGLKRDNEILINPGLSMIIEKTDVLFYICLTQEEDAVIINNTDDGGEIGDIARTFASGAEKALFEEEANRHISIREQREQKQRSSSARSASGEASDSPSKSSLGDVMLDGTGSTESLEHVNTNQIVIGFPTDLSIHWSRYSNSLSHFERKKMHCCLRHDRQCTHERFDQSENDPIIVCAEFATQSLINVMIPLRAHFRCLESLNPVILILEHSPEEQFVEAISCFPMVYYMLGNMNSLDSLLIAGVIRAHTIIIIDRMTSVYAEEEYMADSRQLVAAQTIFKLFPTIRTCLELTHTSNMRFNRFVSPNNQISIEELRKERRSEKASSLPYLFRESFASGEVFSSSMLDTLLYQSMVKSYLMTLLRLLLGLQYAPGSGYLSTHKVTKFEENRKYSSIFKEFSFRTGGIILGIYRKVIIERREESISNFKELPPEMESYKGKLFDDSELQIPESPPNPVKKRRHSINVFSMKKSIRSKLPFKNRKHANLSVRRLQLLQHNMTEREKLDTMIQARATRLGISKDQFPAKQEKTLQKSTRTFGYVLLNPAPDTVLKKGDTLYIIRPETRSHTSTDTMNLSATSSSTGMNTIDETSESGSVFLEKETPKSKVMTKQKSSTLPNGNSLIPETSFQCNITSDDGTKNEEDISTTM
uniref:potassium channel subfamily T member 2-like isoform X1 n=1 Tax=Styela clava TaxID=7725 RepID=UPI00193ABD76|nr:potassium channel subfamily T member 2-like isoform X1 [Styela clava]